MSDLTPQQLRSLLSQDSEDVYLPLLRISHPGLDEDILLAYNTESVVRSDGTYRPYPFEVAMPEKSDEEAPTVSLSIDNTDLEVNDKIRELVGEPKVTLMVVLGDDPETVVSGPVTMNLANAQGSSESISGTLGWESDIFSQMVPGQNYLPTNSKGLFV